MMGEFLSSLGLTNDLVVAITVYAVIVVAALWLAMVVWTYRDMRSRSWDALAQIGAALLVALLTIPGLLIYVLMRPRETLSDAYERSLEEEALLQEIEEKPSCPGCGQHVKENWQACPHCHTRLKKPCVHCRQLLDLSWQVCPYCTSTQPGYAVEQGASAARGHVRPMNAPEEQVVSASGRFTQQASSTALEFIDGDEVRR